MSSIQQIVYRYGKSLNTHDFIKVLAIVIMVIDHVGDYVFPDNHWLRLIGRIGLPMWFFLIGYVNKLRMNKYLIVYCAFMLG
ncbi:MAG TPA: TraX family protein [Candidatus Berkiella sp.]|nr:TraX family protein [Candidatus Berkiella sp.]